MSKEVQSLLSCSSCSNKWYPHWIKPQRRHQRPGTEKKRKIAKRESLLGHVMWGGTKIWGVALSCKPTEPHMWESIIILPSFLFLWENTDFRSKIHWATYNTKLTPAASMFPQGNRLQASTILPPLSFSNLLNCTATSRTRADEISKRNAVTGE